MLMLGPRARVLLLGLFAVFPLPAQQWAPPQSGWLFVLESGTGQHGRVLLVDPSDGSLKGSLPTAYKPNFGFCGDGKRMYLTDGLPGFLSIIDTESGAVLSRTPLWDRAMSPLEPLTSGVGCTNDGKWLLIEKVNEANNSLAVFDASTGRPVMDELLTPRCGIAQFPRWPFPDWNAAVVCGYGNSVRLLKIDETGAAAETRELLLPVMGTKERIVAEVVTDVDRKNLTVLRASGGLDRVDVATGLGRPVLPDDPNRFSRDGKQLYLVNPDKGSITVVDASTMRKMRTIEGLGKRVSLVWVQP